MRILLGDLKGRIQAEISRGRISDIVWRLNKAGQADLHLAQGDPAFREELLSPGARVYIDFDNGLPAWGGVLGLPRSWPPGAVIVRAYTVERLLMGVPSAETRAFYGEMVGSIFAAVLREAEARADIGISLGQIWRGGGPHYPRYHLREVMWIINQSLRKMEQCDYRFVPYIEDGRVQFRAELHKLLGDDKRNSVVLEPPGGGSAGNIVGVPNLTDQGELYNRIIAVGDGSTWGERPIVYGEEKASQRRYGLRTKVLTPSGVSQTPTLNGHVDNGIREYAYPRTVAALSVADRAPAEFAAYHYGDIVRVNLPEHKFNGYEAPMRIMARGYDPVRNICELVLHEQYEYLPQFQGEDQIQPGEPA